MSHGITAIAHETARQKQGSTAVPAHDLEEAQVGREGQFGQRIKIHNAPQMIDSDISRATRGRTDT